VGDRAVSTALQALCAAGVRVHPVFLGEAEEFPDTLARVAAATGGSAFCVPPTHLAESVLSFPVPRVFRAEVQGLAVPLVMGFQPKVSASGHLIPG
jgi:hypothetical protein